MERFLLEMPLPNVNSEQFFAVPFVIITACPRNTFTPLRFCSFYFDRNSEMEGRRELSDVLN